MPGGGAPPAAPSSSSPSSALQLFALLQLFVGLRLFVRLRIRTRRRTEDPGDVGQVEHGEEDAQALNNGGPELAVELQPVEAVPSVHGLDAGFPVPENPLPWGCLGLEAIRQEVVYELLVVGGPHDAGAGTSPNGDKRAWDPR